MLFLRPLCKMMYCLIESDSQNSSFTNYTYFAILIYSSAPTIVENKPGILLFLNISFFPAIFENKPGILHFLNIYFFSFFAFLCACNPMIIEHSTVLYKSSVQPSIHLSLSGDKAAFAPLLQK